MYRKSRLAMCGRLECPPNANGANIAVSPKHTCIASGRFWAIACPGFAFAGVAFSLRGPRCLPWLVRWLVRADFLRPVTLPASGPVRRSVPILRSSPSTWRFRDRFDALSFRSSGPLRRSSAFLPSFPTAVKPADWLRTFAAFAVRQIQTEVILRRVFQHCCGHRCQIEPYVFPFRFSRFQLHLQVRCHRLDQIKLRPGTESRKRKMVHLSTM